MKHSIKTGFSFGLTSATITTLGLMVGLHSGTHSKEVVIGGIITIAIADAFSDALGIHVAEEAENTHTALEIWEATLATFFFKFIFALTFSVPVFFLELTQAIIVSVIWGLSVLTALTFYIAQDQEIKTWKLILEHVGIAATVIILTHYVGDWVGKFSS
ncbi:MAG: hypothetical protein HZA78_07605 [Candidatus Schekmanbacteria bacterium]|nr:hypothetical protein [Candidatus Schekmanbacteria bacterium]